MAREINLVPDIKDDMIRAIKLRNYIFFLCFVISGISIAVTSLTGLTAGGQQIAVNSKKGTIDNLSAKLNSYEDLKDFLTIKNQLNDIDNLANNKPLLSRTFGVLSAILPNGADRFTVSEMTVDFSEGDPTFILEAQANAGQAPYIDYNVLDAFKKSMKYMRYDYGNYVDRDGNDIPAYCMIENSSDGSTFKDPERGIYALWTINAEGCNSLSASDTNNDSTNNSTDESTDEEMWEPESKDPVDAAVALGYQTEEYDGRQVVRIWRTPQFNEWYITGSNDTNNNDSAEDNDDSNNSKRAYMSLDGEISNVPHFVSSCVSYTGHEDPNYNPGSDETVYTKVNGVTWVGKNESCKLVPNDEEGIVISESSNGRGEGNELVLRFNANITFDPGAFAFENANMLFVPPSGYRNVTDSYVQIQSMFGERAADCAEDDIDCINANGGQNNNRNQNERNE